MQFLSRRSAGLELAVKLKPIIAATPIVLSMPGGGRSMANEVSRGLKAPVYPLLVRKLGVPGHDQLSMGAIASGVQFLDQAIIGRLGIADSAIRRVLDRERLALQRDKEKYLRKHGRLDVSGKTAILIDEGIAGNINSIRAGAEFLCREKPDQLLIAAPVVSSEAADRLTAEGLSLIWLQKPDPFINIDHWYEQMVQTEDFSDHC